MKPSVAVLGLIAAGSGTHLDPSLTTTPTLGWNSPKDVDHAIVHNHFKTHLNRKENVFDITLTSDSSWESPEVTPWAQYDVFWSDNGRGEPEPALAFVTVKVEAMASGPSGYSATVQDLTMQHGKSPRFAKVHNLSNQWITLETVTVPARFVHHDDPTVISAGSTADHHAQAIVHLGKLSALGGGSLRERISLVGLSLTDPNSKSSAP